MQIFKFMRDDALFNYMRIKMDIHKKENKLN
jgi:hypothetical protein